MDFHVADADAFDLLDLSMDELNQLFEPFESRDDKIDSVDEFIESQKKLSTKQATERDIRNVQRWLYDNKREPRSIENIIPDHLNTYLAEMFITIRKSNGSDYEPCSLESIKNSIERHLKAKGYPVSLSDRPFYKSVQALNSKKKMQLKKAGFGRKSRDSEPINQDDEEALFSAGEMGSHTPAALQFSLFYFFGKIFGFRGRDEQRKLKFGDVSVFTDSTGTQYLQYAERDSKTFDGTRRDDYRSTIPRIFSTGTAPERDPVHLYLEYFKRRPSEMMDVDSPFYLTPIPVQKLTETSQIWYYPRPMGVNQLGSLMKLAAERAEIQGKITNHSVRKTTVTTLSKAGVPPTKIMQVTGHTNMSSIAAYDSKLSMAEQKYICSLLSTPVPAATCTSYGIDPANNPSPSQVDKQNLAGSTEKQNTFIPDQLGKLFQGAVIHNMTLNFNFE